ncbi:hypothetical protein Tco_1296282 [Tanacetum coccineum]
MEDNKETTELQMLVKILPDEEEVAVDAIPLATKPLFIVDYKIHKEEKTSYYKITRANGSSKMYKVFSQLLKSIDREDLETLWRVTTAERLQLLQGLRLLQDNADEKITAVYTICMSYIW